MPTATAMWPLVVNWLRAWPVASAAQPTWKVSRRSISDIRSAMGLDPSIKYYCDRKTKIICTIGPASIGRIKDLILAGMDVARINCAHGDRAFYEQIVNNVRKATQEIRRDGLKPRDVERADAGICAVAFDVKGPEIRVGRFGPSVAAPQFQQLQDDGTSRTVSGPKEIVLTRGDVLTITTDPALADTGTAHQIYIGYQPLTRQLKPGSLIYIDDGNVELEVTRVEPAARRLQAVAHTSAPIGERKGVNLPGVAVDLPSITAKDEVDIRTARELGADIIFASFIRSGAMVAELQHKAGPSIQVVAKIENEQGLDNYDEILAHADGIMVARGDLGVQIPPERVFLAQKRMVARANLAGRPIICATQMLESMTDHPRPTRAECVDVASAVLDGADAVMLSSETAKGKYPVETVAMMSRICQAAEAAYPNRNFFAELAEMTASGEGHRLIGMPEDVATATAAGTSGGVVTPVPISIPVPAGVAACDLMSVKDLETLASSAVHASFEIKAAMIVVISVSGRTASYVAKYRPQCPILVVTADEAVARRLQLRRGVQAVVVEPGQPIAQLTKHAMSMGQTLGIARPGDRVVLVHGTHTLASEGGVQVSLAHV